MVSYGDLLDHSGAFENEEAYLDEVIKRINERYQGTIESITKEITKGNRRGSLATYAKNVRDFVFNLYSENMDRDNAFNRIFQNKELYKTAQFIIGEQVYSELRRSEKEESGCIKKRSLFT